MRTNQVWAKGTLYLGTLYLIPEKDRAHDTSLKKSQQSTVRSRPDNDSEEGFSRAELERCFMLVLFL